MNNIKLDIEPIFNGEFPIDYKNDVYGWGLSRDILHSKYSTNNYSLLTIDIDFGTKCSLNCPHCFKKNNYSLNDRILEFKDVKEIILEAKKLGLRFIKILGAGEPFENSELIALLRFTTSLDIHVAIFTKGHVLGSDFLTKKYFSKYGITKSKELVSHLYELKTSILFGFNSFEEQVQNTFVGNPKEFNYFTLRNNALLSLVDAKFNKYSTQEATRLALVASPIKLININENFDIYKWGHERNMYVVTCPTVYSGLGKNEYISLKSNFNHFMEKLEELYVNIYNWAVLRSLISIDEILQDGISLYAGGHPCNQVAGGFYITYKGNILRCPGFDISESISNIIDYRSLKEAWVNSGNYCLAQENDRFNFGCIAREDNLFNKHPHFFTNVQKKVIKNFTNGL